MYNALVPLLVNLYVITLILLLQVTRYEFKLKMMLLSRTVTI